MSNLCPLKIEVTHNSFEIWCVVVSYDGGDYSVLNDDYPTFQTLGAAMTYAATFCDGKRPVNIFVDEEMTFEEGDLYDDEGSDTFLSDLFNAELEIAF